MCMCVCVCILNDSYVLNKTVTPNQVTIQFRIGLKETLPNRYASALVTMSTLRAGRVPAVAPPTRPAAIFYCKLNITYCSSANNNDPSAHQTRAKILYYYHRYYYYNKPLRLFSSFFSRFSRFIYRWYIHYLQCITDTTNTQYILLLLYSYTDVIFQQLYIYISTRQATISI